MGGLAVNILGIINDKNQHTMDAVQYYRIYLPLREVNRNDNGIDATVVDQNGISASSGLWDGRDVYVMCRLYHADCEAFIAEVHRRGAVLILDSDDDLTEDFRLVSGRGDEFKKALGMVDYVTVSTPALAVHLGKYTREPPTVLRNCVDVDWMTETAGQARRLVEGLTMGFIGSPTHWGDWYLPTVPFARVCREFDVIPVFAGDALPLYLEYTGLYTLRLGAVPFVLYPIVLSQLDIALCAVDSGDKFNSGKSAVKALECMALGIVPICSRFGPYMALAVAGAPVVIVAEDSREGWYEAMKTMVTDDEQRLALSSQGPGWVKANRDMVRGGHECWTAFYLAAQAGKEIA